LPSESIHRINIPVTKVDTKINTGTEQSAILLKLSWNTNVD